MYMRVCMYVLTCICIYIYVHGCFVVVLVCIVRFLVYVLVCVYLFIGRFIDIFDHFQLSPKRQIHRQTRGGASAGQGLLASPCCRTRRKELLASAPFGPALDCALAVKGRTQSHHGIEEPPLNRWTVMRR